MDIPDTNPGREKSIIRANVCIDALDGAMTNEILFASDLIHFIPCTIVHSTYFFHVSARFI